MRTKLLVMRLLAATRAKKLVWEKHHISATGSKTMTATHITYEKRADPNCLRCKGSALACTYPNGAPIGDDEDAQWYRCHCTDGKAVPIEDLDTALDAFEIEYRYEVDPVLWDQLRKRLGVSKTGDCKHCGEPNSLQRRLIEDPSIKPQVTFLCDPCFEELPVHIFVM